MTNALPRIVSARGIAAVRAAEALLRTLGGGAVVVRIRFPLEATGNNLELGIAGAATEDVTLSPVVVRNFSAQQGTELLISAATLARAREIQDAATAREFFSGAVGVVVEERLLRILFVQVDELAGTPYLYRVKVGE